MKFVISCKALIRRSLLIKPAGSFCNFRCDYCFYLQTHALYDGVPATHCMSDATLDKAIQDMFACSDQPTFIWHGGEPTLMGLKFFMKIVLRQRYHAKGREYFNAIQTNGSLLNEEWAQFLKVENFLVGISLDGPAHVHNRYRKDMRGNGTFQQVFENAQMLLHKRVPLNVLATVNAYSLKHVNEIYHFFKKHNLTIMQFMPVVENDPQNPGAAAPYSVNAKDYGLKESCAMRILFLFPFILKYINPW